METLSLLCLLLGLVSISTAFVLPGGPSVLPPKDVARSASTCGASRPLQMVLSSNGDLPFDPLGPIVDEHMKVLNSAKPRMMEGGGEARTAKQEYYDGARIGPPPDLPSLLLHNRIIYLGMPLVPAVTELIIAELLYLNYESTTRPIYMYLNTPGTSTPDGRSVGFETEAFAIADTMKYIRPPIYTICVGQAFGTGAMLLAQGEKGHRAALPNASIMLHQPRSMARGQASDIRIKAKEVLANRKVTTTMLAQACGKRFEDVEKDASRTFYMSPEEAMAYGIIDKVLPPKQKKDLKKKKPNFLDAISDQSWNEDE